MNENEVRKLYSALISKGYKLDNEDTFISSMNDKENRKKLYDFVSSKRNFKIGDYDTFESRLTSSSPSVSVESAQAADPVSQVKQDSQDIDIDEWMKSVNEFTPTPKSNAEYGNVDAVNKNNNEPEYETTLKGSWKQGWKGLGHGLQHLGGEVLNLFTGSTIDEEKALAKIAELERDSIDIESVIAPLDKAKKMYYNNIANPSPEVHIEATEEEIAFARQALEDDAINKTIRKYIEKAGSLEEAKSMLAERANEETQGDKWIKQAAKGLAELKPTKGFGAWVGNLLPQMVPAAASMAVGAVTKNPIATQTVGGLSLVTMSASTAGMSMNEAREAGATGLQTWAVGIADGAIEFLTEKIPFDNYVSRVLTGTKRKIGGELSEAMVDSPPAREEIERLLQEANKKLGGKLFNGKNVKDFVGDIIAEGASEFTAEALQTITPMIYENPEDYPTITEIIRNGLEGAKAGVFMGSVLGGASKTMEHYQHRNRRKEQGFVSVVEFKTKDGHKIGEALGMDDKGFVVVLADGKQQRVMPEDILYGHKFSFEEFDRAELQMENEESFDNGYSLSEQQEMNDAKNMLEVKKAEMIRTFGLTDESDIDAFLGDNPIETVAQRRQNGESQESSQTIIDYLNAKATYDGMIQRVRDDIDGQIEQSNALIDSHTNKHTGKIHGAVSKEDGRLVYIVSGNVVPYQDGSGIDLQNSDENIIVRDAETGELKQMSPEFLSSLYDTQDPNEQKEINAQQIREKILSEESNKIDGVVDFNDKEQLLNEIANQIAITMILAQRGLDVDYIKTFLGNAQIVENPDGTLTFTDGQNEVVVPKQEIQQQVDANNMQRAVDFNDKAKEMRNAIQQATAATTTLSYGMGDNVSLRDTDGNIINGTISMIEDDTYVIDYSDNNGTWHTLDLTQQELDNMIVGHNGATLNQPVSEQMTVEETAEIKNDDAREETTLISPATISSIPKDESGNPIYEQADSETAWDALIEDAEGDEMMAGEVAKSMIADKEAELKKLEKSKIKEGKTPAEKMAALKERKAEVEKIKQDIEAWKKIAAVPMQRQIAQQERIRQEEAEAAAKRKADEERLLAERLEAERKEQELLNGIPDYSEDTPQNARARGYRRVNGHIEERQQPIEAVQGKETEVEFSNDVRPKGHYAVIDASQLQPSHIQGNRNPLHFLDEAQPKERNDKASIVSAQKIAGNIRPATITTGETAYVGTPTVNTRGEVIQGNSRSDALKLMYGNHNDQAQTYKQYLMDNAEQFGLNPEDVSNMESPVLVRMLDINDEQAITLGQYVAQDTESGGIERIKPKNAVKKMGEDIGSFANILLKSNDEDVSFAELLDQNGVEVLKWMAQKSYITPTQYNSQFDTKGSLTAEAKNDLRGIMYQSIFEGGNTRLEEMFNALPAKAQKAILATAHRDFNSPNSERMIEEIQNSIRAFYALMQDEQFAKAKNFKEATKAVESWQKQYQMDDVTGESYLPSEKFTNFALHLALLYKSEKQSNIQGVFSELYDLIQGTKEGNLFEQADNTPRTLVQAIKEVLNIDYNGQRRNNVLVGDNKTSQQGQHGRTGDVASEKRTESREQSADNSGRTDEDSGSPTFETNRQTENESGDIRTAQTVHQSGSEREGFEQTLDGRRQTDGSGMADDNATVLEKRTSRSDIRVLEEGLDAKRGDNTEHSERTRRTAESERLVNTAKQHGLFIPAEVIMTLTGKYPKRTGESGVYIDTEAGKVTKVKDPYAKSAMKSGVQPEDAIFEHSVHNLLFPETAYTLEGISEELGDVRIVLTQDYIQTKGHPTKEQITEALAKRGLFPEDKYSFGNEFVSVTDVEGDNVLLGEDGTVYFIDPIIRFKKPLKEILDNYNRNNNSTLGEQIKSAEKEVNTSPTDKQKEAGNYKKGHVQIGTFNITIEQPKGSVRSGVDANGRKWETTMHNTYGYIRGTEGVDGDHIDVFLSDDIDSWNGNNVFVVDQYNEDGTFDEHKVMLGFNTIEEAESAYLDNYEKGWEKKHKIEVSPIHTDNFEKWIVSSHRKTKPFAEYKSVKSEENRTKSTENDSKVEESSASNDTSYTIEPAQYTTKKGKVLDMHLVKFDKPLTKEQQQAAKELAKFEKGWYDRERGGFMMRSNESAKTLANSILNDENAVADAQPVSMNDIQSVNDGNVLFSEPQQTEQPKAPKNKKVHTPIWQYIIHVDDDGYTMLSREDISGEIPILDDWGYSSESPEEMLEILRNPQNNMQEVLNAVEVTLENKIKTRDFDRKIREEREQKRIELRTNGVNGYKIGDRVIYTPVSGTRKPVEATIHDFEEYGDNKPVLDTGLAPVMYEVVEWKDIQNEAHSKIVFSSAFKDLVSEDGKYNIRITKIDGTKRIATANLNTANVSGNGMELSFEEMASILNEYNWQEKKTEAQTVNPSGNRLVTDERYAELRERMRRKLGGQMNIGIDPEILAIGTEMAVYHLEKGARKFAEYAKSMIADLGDAIRPYLKAFYNGARDLPEVVENGLVNDMTSYEDVQTFDVANFDKSSINAIATAETVIREEEVEKEVEIAKDRIKKNRNNHNNKKKSVNSQGQTGSLFDDLFNNENSNDDGLQRNDEVRSEGLSADNNINTGTGSKTGNSQEVQQESGRTDGNRDGGSQRTGREIQNGNVRSSGRLQGLTEKKNTRNNRSERGQNHAPTSVDARIEANIKAIELAKQLLENGEQATKEQMEVLRKFSGWGGLGKAFNERASYVHEGRHYYNEPTVENKKIRELLGEEAYQQAENSKYSSFYTPAYIVDTLWDIAEQMGFKGGNILEGSAGIGNILGQMPAHISENSDIHAIEIDNTSGGILSLLYPDAKVEVQGFEETHITNGSVDLAITNVPFITDWHVKDTSGDKDLSRKFHNIHDFCIAKNVRKLREGGIGIFITSNGTLDSSKKLRDWIVSEGNSDFVGAFRMHNKTFGGTSVTSDIIVIRKRVNGQKSVNTIDVSTVSGERTTNFDTGETRKVKGVETSVTKQLSMDYNRYFIEHPERMAGEMHFAFEKGDTYRPTSKGLYPSQDKNQEQMLTEFVKSFTAEEFGNKASNDVDVIDAMPGKKIGEMFVKDGKLYINAIGAAQPLDVNANKVKGHTKAECFKAYSSIKDALKEVLDYQSNHESDNGLKPLLEKLNKAYDDFVSTYGHFNKNTSIAFLRNDVDYANVASVETYKETGDGKGGIKQTFGKADVLTKRVIEKEKEPTPTNVKDGIVASMFKHGRIDIQYIAEQLGKSEADVKKEIISKGYGFEDPITRQIEVSYQYLSGNVREKLLQAQENNENGEFNSNIKALQEILPMNIPAHLIDFTLGSSWIDSQLYDDYVKDRTDVEVKFTAVGGTWFMKEPYYTGYEKNRSMGVTSEMLGKTIMGHTLIEAAIQNKSITVSTTRKNWDGSTETIIDKEATQACASKIDEIRQDFKEWARQKMQSDPELSAKMERIYNDTFNNYVPVKVTDEFLPKYFAGAIHKYEMRPHQKRAIVRGTMQPLMLAHEVGSGKTFTLISTAMEMRRLGTARKPMIVVQNATVGQFVASAKELYPNAKILTLEDGDRNAEGRKNFYAKIKYNDWDMIVVPQSTFEFIPDSEEREMAFIQDKIEEKMLILEQMKNADPDGNSMITRQAEREIAMLEEELAGLSEMSSKKRTANDEKKRAVALQNAEVKAMEMLDRRTDDVENFDDMGIDALLVDEAHEYKHLGFATAMQRGVKGVDPSYSKKSQGVFLKTQAVLEKNNGRNVIFATGTPISNTAAEIWTFMRYLMHADTMKEYGIYYFDDFVRNFGNIQQMLEFTTSGKFKENNRFAGYVNLPELVRIWSGVSDTVNFEDIEDDLKKQGKDDLRPEIENGKAQDIYLPQTRALRGIMKFVKAQLDAFDQMSGKMKKENSHIPLTMYGIAKAAAVDARLVQSDAEDDPNSKTNEAVRQTLRSLKETESYKGTIAIFADNYQNKESGFNLYEDIRSKLIAEGVSSNEIAVIKSGMTVKKKLEIFEKVNRGEIRVILGSTFTLGTGVNIQERLHTLIHLDAPNRPMDYTQRNGRIQRQGNIHKGMGIPVRILRFGVEDSLDVTAYQRLKTKGAIADSIMKGKQMMSDSMTNRVLEEEEDVFGDTVAQLSGSEYAMLKNNAEKNVRKYQSRKKQWEADQTYIHNAKPRIKGLIKDAETRIEQNSRNLKEVQSAFPDGKFKEITIGKKRFTSIESMEDFFKEHNKSVIADTKKIKDGEMSGNQTREVTIHIDGYSFIVKTELTKEFSSKGINMFSEVHRKMTYSCPQLGIENVPVKQALLRNGVEDIVNNIITGKDFAELLEASEHSKKHNETELEQLISREGKPFEYEKELEQAQKQFVEYSELMKKEMAEKEAKYAEMDASVEAASDIANAEEDDEVLYRSDNEDSLNKNKVNYPAQRRQMVEHAENLAKRLHLDNIEIVNSVSGLEGKKKSAKGFYDPKTGKITIVIPNNTSIADIEKTLLHEAVAHYGLRQLFGEHFDTFLDNVYNNADESIRKRIAELAIRKYNYDFRKATEEYLASLAESTNFENAQQSSWWQKVKDFFADMLSKLGFRDFRGVTLTDNELRYILWRSYENLSSKRHKGVFGQAADIAKQYELGVGDYAKSSENEDDVLFRDGDPEIHEKELVRDKYDRRIRTGWYQSKEAMQDSMLSLKEAMKDIAGMEIEDIDGFENAYLGENRLSSVNKAEADAFARILFKPMLDEVAKLAPTAAERQELVDYMMAKHGLERNEYMRQQAMQNGEDANRDFAGLTSLTGFDDITAAEAEAQIMVNEYEQNHDTTELWDNVNAVSKAILSKTYECGLIDKDTFENISNMYEFYIPLRGFEEKTSDEAYAYLSHIHNAFNAPIKKAEGRTSKADDPFAYLQSMAESAIMQGNRNKLVKQRFLNFVLNHPSDLVSISELWLEYDNIDDEWRPVFPDNIDTNDSGEVVEQKMKDFDEKMELLSQNEPDRYKKGRDAIGIPYRVVEKRDLQQHQVIVKRNGRDVVLTVNGNPRLAQALNGQTNPDNDMSGAIGTILRSGEWVNRQLSAFYTTRNPDFIVSNFLRDMLYSNSMAWIKESPNYALRFNRNYMIANPITMKRLLNKYRKGTLDTSDKIEGMFYQFMMNGGETGYANVRDIEQHKNDIRKELRRSNGRLKIGRAFSLLAERFDELNRAIENCARFAAFMTSKEMGRTTDRAIYDAKEISVNFNKKGSGSKFYGEIGQTVAGNTSSLISGLGRSSYVFWNAAIQGTTNFGRQIKRHPAKAFTGIASMFLLGALVAFLGGDDDDDDNKNSYYNLPEYVRRSNILFSAGKHWISIPLPVEYRAIYGLGELMISTISGKEHLTDSEIAEAIIGQMSQVLPLDFMEGGGGLNAVVPSAAKPLWEAYVAEKSWTGLPLYKDTPYNKNMPEWTKAYSSANKHIVNLTASLNEVTGGDRYTKGNIDINPSKIEYVLKGYFGGVFNTIDKMAKMAETATGEREYEPQNFLLLNRVVKAGDERTEYRAVNNEYFRLKKEHDDLKSRIKNYENDTYNGIFDYANKIDFLYNSPEYQRYEIFELYKKEIESLNDMIKNTYDNDERKELETYLNEIKKEMIEEMNKTRKRA
jgi:N12 class adenine-specific DNA methylase